MPRASRGRESLPLLADRHLVDGRLSLSTGELGHGLDKAFT
jgi:hypothetical protein